MVVSVAGKLQHHWPEKAAGEKQLNNLGGGARLDPAKKPDADAPVTSRFGLLNVAANVPANVEEKLEPVFAKIELKHAWNDNNDAVLGVKKDFSTNKEVLAFKVPLKRVSLEPKVAAPVAVEPAKRSLNPEPSNPFKVDLKKSAPPKEASSESKIATPAMDLKKTSSIVRPSITAQVAQPVYKKDFDLAKAEAAATRPSLSTSAHNEEPLFQVDLKKTSSIVRPSITAQVEQPVYKKEFALAKAEAASAKPNHSTSAHNEDPLFKVDLKKTSSIVRPGITVQEEKPVYKKDFDLAKAEAAATRPNLNTSQEPLFKVGLKHVGPVEKPAAIDLSVKKEPPFNLTLNKKVDDPAPPAASMSGKSAETVPFKLPLKKVEAAEKPVSEDSAHNKEPLFKVDLKKTSSVVRPSITAQVEQPVYKKEFDLAKAEAAAAKPNLPTSQEPSFKVGLKHVDPVEKLATNEIAYKKEPTADLTLKKVDDHAPPPGNMSERPAEAGLFHVPLKRVETVEKPIAHAEEPVFKVDLKKTSSVVRPSITAQVEQPVYKKEFDLAKAEAAAAKPHLTTSEEPSFKVELKHVEPVEKPATSEFMDTKANAGDSTFNKNDAVTGDNAHQPTSPAPLRKASTSPRISGDVNDKASLADRNTNSRSSGLVPKFVHEGEDTNASLSVINARRSSAQNELGALRALGLTKAISTKGLESNYDAASKKKEDEELEALRIRGLATFKMVDPTLNPAADTPAGVAEQRFKADEELAELRSKGLATTFSNNETPTDQKVDVGPSVSSGLTKAQEEIAVAKPDEIPAERRQGESGITSPATDRSHAVLESDGEDGMFLDTDDESGALVILPEPDTGREEQACEDANEDTPASDAKDASASPEAATNLLDVPGKLEKKKNKKSFEESTPTFTPEEKAALRRQRRESKEQFKGIKRFIFGKKGVKSAE